MPVIYRKDIMKGQLVDIVLKKTSNRESVQEVMWRRSSPMPQSIREVSRSGWKRRDWLAVSRELSGRSDFMIS